jgi:HPt (histidine-containing phosphotransfer) domain-containing protein
LAIFVEEAPGRREAFEKAAGARDIEALQKLGHALKGSSLSLCAEPLGACAGALESACLSAKRSGNAEAAAFTAIAAGIEDLGSVLTATAEAAEAILASDA